MISRGKRRAIIIISIIFFVLCLVVSFLIGAEGGPIGYINVFSFIIPLIGVMQFEVVMFVFIAKGGQSEKLFLKMSLRTQMLIMGWVGIVFIVLGIVVDATHLPPKGGPYISNLGTLGMVIGCIYLAMIVGTYVRERVFAQKGELLRRNV